MTSKNSVYSVHPGVYLVQKWIAGLKEKTGRTLDEWLALIKEKGPSDEQSQREWLKQEYKLSPNSAWWLAERVAGKGWEDGDPASYLAAAEQYVEAMFSGGKAGLRPLFEELLRVGRTIGDDVKFCPGKTIVPFYRHHVFAEIKPSTRTRIDLGFALKDTASQGRLIAIGKAAKGNRISHRIAISTMADIDAEVTKWLKTAYEMDAK